METSIVYVLGNGSKWNNLEIRLSLRSIEKHLKNYGQVFVIGDNPKLKNVIHIQAEDPHAIPDSNILHKLTIACSTPEISDTFLFVNDDHYLLSDYEADKFPYFYSGTLQEYVKRRGKDTYRNRVENTLNSLTERSLPTKFFDIHTPILYKKDLFLKHVTGVYDPTKRDGMVLKSLYGNAIQAEGVQMQDGKLDKLPLRDMKIVSSMPRMRCSIKRYLFEQFPKPSIFE